MTEIFINSRLLSPTYKSHAGIRGGNTQNIAVFFGENRLGQRANAYKTRDFIGKHSDIEYPFSALSYFAHVDSSIFIHVAPKEIFPAVYFPRLHLGYSRADEARLR